MIAIKNIHSKFHIISCIPPQIDFQLVESTIKYIDDPSHLNIEIFKYLDSTNNYLLRRKNYDFNQQCIDIVIAEVQTQGRGRYGRSWTCGLGEGLTFSLSKFFKLNSVAMSGLSLVIGIAVIRVLNQFGILVVGLKWPNDVIAADNLQKIAGILIDLQQVSPCISRAIIGIGINFDLSQTTINLVNKNITDLSMLVDFKLNKNIFLGNLLIELKRILDSYETLGFHAFKDEWIKYHLYEGKRVNLVHSNRDKFCGFVCGVGDDGALCLNIDGKQHFFHVGEYSLSLGERI